MRSNGLHLALAALLAPAAAFAQGADPTDAETPGTQAVQVEPGADAPALADAGVGIAAPSSSPEPLPAAADGQDAPAPEDPRTTDGSDAAVADIQEPPVQEQRDPAEPEVLDSEALDPEVVETQADAEAAFEDIYGPAETGVANGAFDPWEKYNRKMHRFNNAVDRTVAKPLARGYVRVVPRPLRTGVSNFFNNLSQPLTALNSLLQGKPRQAGTALGRFMLNTTFGIGGLFDPASKANLPQKSEDFGQTLGVWGWRRSRYVELPLFGPRTVRDVFGMGGDAPLSPLRNVEADRIRLPLQGLQLVDLRSRLLATDSLREGAEDDYALVRDAWSQRRDYQIFGERAVNGEDLPDYLQEEDTDSTVPVDAMPVDVPGAGG